MVYITPDDYKGFGYPELEEGEFKRLSLIASADVDYFTFNRINETTEITDKIKLAVCEIMQLYHLDSKEQIVSSSVTGKYSETYATTNKNYTELQVKIRDICLKYLPQSLTTWVVDL